MKHADEIIVVAPLWLTDDEIDELAILTEDPSRWPAIHRPRLPLIRDLVLLWQRQRAEPSLTVDEIARRIGHH